MTPRSRKERRERIREGARSFDELKKEKREFVRLSAEGTIQFMTCDTKRIRAIAEISNLSQSGILIRTTIAPKMGTVIAMTFPADQVTEVIRFREVLCEDDGAVIGKVVRVTPLPEHAGYEVAVNLFIKG